jgi:large subunit ribosomal protein L29
MKPADLREKSVEDLRELAKTLARDVFQNRLKNFTNRLDDTSAVRKSKRDYARVATLLRERELGIRAGDAAGESAAEKPAKKATKRAAAASAQPKESAGASSEAKPAKKAATKKSSAKKSEAK